MKKHLIAAAVAAAVAVPAMAQNVTVYGTVDYGYQRYDNGSDTYMRSASGALATSRLGFRGTEDLGGGLKANFQVQGTLNMSGTSATAFGFDEEAWVGLSGSFGEIRVGRTDVTAAEGMDTTISRMGNLGNSVSLGAENGELGGNAPNVIRYISPKFGGLSLQVGYAGKNDRTAQSDTNTPVTSVSARYDVGTLSVMGGYSKEKAATGFSGRDHKIIGAIYDAGVASFGLYYSTADQSTAAGNDSDVKRTAVTAAVPMGNGVSLHGGYFKAKLENSANNSGDGYVLAVTKALSKRTTAYGAFSSADSDSAGRFGLSSTTASTTANGVDTKAITVGIAHSF